MIHITSKIRALFFFLVMILAENAGAQVIDSMMNVYSQRFPQEKIYVQFDKSYYNPGETIWFKAYLMNGTLPSFISKNFYAELLADDGTVLQRKTAPIIGGSAASSFDIPAKFKSTSVHFRAYTTWMLNFDEAFIYEKNIRIISATASKTTAAPVTLLRFFPEGGDLVTNVESTVAFKANDGFGKPVNIKGQILTSAGKKVTDFVSTHNGMGTVVLTPSKGEKYKAIWKDASGKDQSVELPISRDHGVAMHLVNNSSSVVFSIKKDVADSGKVRKLILMGHINQEIVYKAKINFSTNNSVINGKIPTDQLPAGIMQVTLFEDEDKPLQERIVFINNNDYMFDAYVSPGIKKMTKRAKNVFEIEVPDTLVSNLSIAITDADINITDDTEDNIYSHLLLTGDIKGYVYNPGYYFSSFADSLSKQLDLVMLTNGWRRFKWEDLAQSKDYPIKFNPENFFTIKGSVNGIDPSKLPNGTLLNMILQFKDSSKQIFSAPLDKQGKFGLDGMLFYDTVNVYYQFNNNKGLADRVSVAVDNDMLKKSLIAALPSSNDMVASYLIDSAVVRNKRIVQQYSQLEAERAKRAKVLDEVVVKGRAKSNVDKLDDTYANGMFKGGDGYSFDPMSDPVQTSQSVFQYLQGKVAGLQIAGNPSDPTLSWRGGSPGLYLDEIQQQDPQQLTNLSMADVAYIKVFRPPFMGGFGGANGAIAIYTKRGQDRPADNTFKRLNTLKVAGYSAIKEFYTPNYEEYNPSQELNDLRTTLYWNPFLFFDKDKKKTAVTFYNSDITKKFRVIIEGVNANGKLTRVEEIIQ